MTSRRRVKYPAELLIPKTSSRIGTGRLDENYGFEDKELPDRRMAREVKRIYRRRRGRSSL